MRARSQQLNVNEVCWRDRGKGHDARAGPVARDVTCAQAGLASADGSYGTTPRSRGRGVGDWVGECAGRGDPPGWQRGGRIRGRRTLGGPPPLPPPTSNLHPGPLISAVSLPSHLRMALLSDPNWAR